MSERGVIRNIQFARQRADFSGMQFRNITPTDIDGYIEFGDEVFIFMETKHGDADLPLGQCLALERVCDRVQKSGAEALVLVLRDESAADARSTYRIAPLLVSRYRYRGKWYVPKEQITAKNAVEKFAVEKLGREIQSADSGVPALGASDTWVADYEKHEVPEGAA